MTTEPTNELFITKVREQLQEYLDESSVESNNFITGLDVTHDALQYAFNDFLLFISNGMRPSTRNWEINNDTAPNLHDFQEVPRTLVT
jgi:hypothetical protein